MKHWPLKYKLAVLMASLPLFVCTATILFALGEFQSRLSVEIGGSLENQADHIQKTVKLFIADKVGQLQVATLSKPVLDAVESQNGGYEQLDVTPADRIAALDLAWRKGSADDPLIESVLGTGGRSNEASMELGKLLKAFSDHSEIFVTDRYGATVAATGRLSDYNQADEEWWQAAWHEGEGRIFISQPTFDQSAGVWALLIAVPIINEKTNRVAGIARSTLSLRSLMQLIAQFRFGDTGSAAILGRRGQTIIGSLSTQLNPALGLEKYRGSGHSLYGENAGEEYIVGYTSIAHASDIADLGMSTMNLDDALRRLGWTAVVLQRKSEAWSGVATVFRSAIFIGIATVMAGLGLALYFASRITKPLERLSAASVELGSGNHDVPLPEPYTKEVAILTKSFKLMSDRITAMVSDLEAARDEALSADRLKASFLATLSHEIRTPLNAILGMIELVSRTELDERQNEYLHHAQNASEHLLQLLNDILDYSKIAAGKMDLENEVFSLEQVMRLSVNICTPLAEEKGVQLVLDASNDTGGEFIGDGGRIRQVLLNLIGNALKFTTTGSVTLRVRMKRSDGAGAQESCRFEVKDTGPGLTPAECESVFNEFEQAEAADGGLVGGTGLGLSICRNLVEVMGGEIGVESLKGLGSNFWFEIPLVRSEDQEVLSDPTVFPSIDETNLTLSILIAEDNQANQIIAKSFVEQLGHEGYVVGNGQSAIDAVRERDFDLILMDVNMPGINGLEAAKILRREGHCPGVPIVALTAHAIGDELHTDIDKTMDGYLTKPVDSDRLRNLIRRLTGHSQRTGLKGPSPATGRLVEQLEPAFIDQEKLCDLENQIGPTQIAAVIDASIDALETAHTKLNEAVTRHDEKSIIDSVHELKGIAGNVGASRLSKSVGDLGNSPAESPQMPNLIETLEQTAERLRHLRQQRNKHRA